jgi:solute:Na+ symporter, SSS family
MTSIWIWLGLAATTLYLLGLLALGFYGSQMTEERVGDYFVAGGTISSLVIFLTGVGTVFSAFTFLGSGGISYDLGLAGVVIIGAIAIIDIPAMVMIGEKFWKMAKMPGKDYVTPADLVCDRFDDSKTIRILIAMIAVGFSFFYIVIQFQGMGLILNVLSEGLISQTMAIVYIGVFMVVYISIGGMRGVAYSDALQAVLLFGGVLAIAVYVFWTQPSDVYLTVAEEAPQITTLTLEPLYLYTVVMGFALSIPVWPHMWQRYYAARRHSGVWGLGFAEGIGDFFLLTISAGIIGFAGILAFPGLEGLAADTVILEFILAMPGWVLMILMAAAIAAAMSTADSIVLMLGSIVSRDIYRELIEGEMSQRELSRLSKLFAGAITVAALLVSLRPLGEIIQVVIDLTFPGYFLLMPVVVAAFWWPRANKYGIIAGLITGLAIVLYFIIAAQDAPYNIWSGFLATAVESVVIVLVSLFTAEPPADRVREFTQDVREADPKSLER